MSDPITAALEVFSKEAIQKMEESEARREREFSYKLKELEFYKGNYDKEIKGIFDGWFNLLQNCLLADNKYLTADQKKKYQKARDESITPEKAVRLMINTIKYGGTETGKNLALYSQISYSIGKDENCPKFAIVYVICILLSTLKREILGQEIAPITIIQVLTTDYIEKSDVINESRCYVEEKMKALFPDEQMI